MYMCSFCFECYVGPGLDNGPVVDVSVRTLEGKISFPSTPCIFFLSLGRSLLFMSWIDGIDVSYFLCVTYLVYCTCRCMYSCIHVPYVGMCCYIDVR